MEWLIGILATLAAAITASMKYHKWGWWLEVPPEPIIAPPQPVIPPPPVVVSKEDLLERMCEAITDFEGWISPCPQYPLGTTSWRNSNPGNLKRLDGTFYKFKTHEEGLTALKDYLLRAAAGKHRAYKSSMTLMQFFHVYTGDPEPSPTNYANYVAKRMAVDSNFWTIGNLYN